VSQPASLAGGRGARAGAGFGGESVEDASDCGEYDRRVRPVDGDARRVLTILTFKCEVSSL
jgi:hypothetical protein